MRPEDLRARVPAGESVADEVRAIVADVRARGDAAVAEYEARFAVDHADVAVPDEALRLAYDNVYAVARASLAGDRDVELPQGHRVRVREIPVRRAGVYAPGGQAPYQSSVIMGVATARAAGVEQVVVCASHPVMRAAAFAADEIHAMGGAHAIAALAYGTETIEPVDVIVGPGSLYAQEAKRQVAHVVGIDGFAGPSDLLIIASEPNDVVRLDALAQAEHGPGTIVAVLSPDPSALEGIEEPVVAIGVDSLEHALAFSEAFAPEHLQLVGAEAEALAPRVTRAGAVFVGAAAGTAFGDYVAGSNHVLPTEGAARFASGLNVRHFLRVMSEVHIPPDAAQRLAGPGVAIAEAEGFAAHAASMAARMDAR